MKPNRREVERRVARFAEVCRDAGIRLTRQRTEIFRELARTGDHPDAETIHARLRRRLPNVSLDTVYRTLWLLNDLGLITTLGPSRERTRFDANLDRHHHFVCTSCGLTRDFSCVEFDGLEAPAPAKAFGRVDMTLVEVRGVCLGCAGKRNRSRDSKPHDARGEKNE